MVLKCDSCGVDNNNKDAIVKTVRIWMENYKGEKKSDLCHNCYDKLLKEWKFEVI